MKNGTATSDERKNPSCDWTEVVRQTLGNKTKEEKTMICVRALVKRNMSEVRRNYTFWAAAPKAPMTYAFIYRANLSFFSSSVHPPPLKLISQSEGSNLVSRLKSQPRG